MSAIPNYVSKPHDEVASISTANANRDGTGTIATIATVSSLGAGMRVDRIKIVATGTTTAGMVRIYFVDASSNKRLHDEVSVTAITPGATQAAFTSTITYTNGWFLPANTTIGAAPHNAETFLVHVEGGDL